MDEDWDNLRLSHVGLPPKLRPAQSDALHWLSQDKSVILCVGTGFISCNSEAILAQFYFQHIFTEITFCWHGRCC